ncbi:MAG TPA: hypothetical protein VGD78_03460 [Chthoniobacterales bacterium]
MDFTKFLSDFSLVTFTTALVLAPRALDTFWAIREQKRAENAGE